MASRKSYVTAVGEGLARTSGVVAAAALVLLSQATKGSLAFVKAVV